MEISSLLNPISTPTWSGRAFERVLGECTAADDSCLKHSPHAIAKTDDGKAHSRREGCYCANGEQVGGEHCHQGTRIMVNATGTGYKVPRNRSFIPSPTLSKNSSSIGIVSPDFHLLPLPAPPRPSTPQPWVSPRVASTNGADTVVQQGHPASRLYLESPRSSVSSISSVSLPVAEGSSARSCFSPYGSVGEHGNQETVESSGSGTMTSPTNTLFALASVAIDDQEQRTPSRGQSASIRQGLLSGSRGAGNQMSHDRTQEVWAFTRHFAETSPRLAHLAQYHPTWTDDDPADGRMGRRLPSDSLRLVAPQLRFQDSETDEEYESSMVRSIAADMSRDRMKERRRRTGTGASTESVVSDQSIDDESENEMLPARASNGVCLNGLPHSSAGLFVEQGPTQAYQSIVQPDENGSTIIDEPDPRCSYTDNCTTGSPLRKVVSHIFGRNKLCTRQIPKTAWVHYCRKHYQRSRYRNPRGFALLQCDLVRKQIDRLQVWGGVTDWIVKVRKREEERLNRENAELAAANLAQTNTRRGGVRNVVSRGAVAATTTSTATAAGTPHDVPGSWAWLVQCTGAGKTTEDVLRILDRIEHEIAASGSNFPDVEILPNVVVDVTAGRSNTARATGSRTTGSDRGSVHQPGSSTVATQRKRKVPGTAIHHRASSSVASSHHTAMAGTVQAVSIGINGTPIESHLQPTADLNTRVSKRPRLRSSAVDVMTTELGPNTSVLGQPEQQMPIMDGVGSGGRALPRPNVFVHRQLRRSPRGQQSGLGRAATAGRSMSH